MTFTQVVTGTQVWLPTQLSLNVQDTGCIGAERGQVNTRLWTWEDMYWKVSLRGHAQPQVTCLLHLFWAVQCFISRLKLWPSTLCVILDMCLYWHLSHQELPRGPAAWSTFKTTHRRNYVSIATCPGFISALFYAVSKLLRWKRCLVLSFKLPLWILAVKMCLKQNYSITLNWVFPRNVFNWHMIVIYIYGV